jgi:hypothetical protein
MTEEQIMALAKHPFLRVPEGRRRSLPKKQRALILAKTNGTCHVCGANVEATFQADHIVPYSHGGTNDIDNYLPICASCNRLRWAYSPDVFKFVIQLGIFAKDEIRRNTPLGKQLTRLASTRLARNTVRRRSKTQSL